MSSGVRNRWVRTRLSAKQVEFVVFMVRNASDRVGEDVMAWCLVRGALNQARLVRTRSRLLYRTGNVLQNLTGNRYQMIGRHIQEPEGGWAVP